VSTHHSSGPAATLAPQLLSNWLTALERRHLADLTFSEVARALRALSANYVERRERLARRTALDSAGKRAAYALYYSPLHVLTLMPMLAALRVGETAVRSVLDLGCGAGAAGATFAASVTPHAQVIGIDEHPWALDEAGVTYRAFGLEARTRRGDVARAPLPRVVDAIVVGWVVNELDAPARQMLLPKLLSAAKAGTHVLIVEPIATRLSPWWPEWSQAFATVGGRADEWRFPVTLPDLLQRLDRAAGLRHDELTARSLYVAPSRTSKGRDATETIRGPERRSRRPA
jgi:SAM-dependent methyltransferase